MFLLLSVIAVWIVFMSIIILINRVDSKTSGTQKKKRVNYKHEWNKYWDSVAEDTYVKGINRKLGYRHVDADFNLALKWFCQHHAASFSSFDIWVNDALESDSINIPYNWFVYRRLLERSTPTVVKSLLERHASAYQEHNKDFPTSVLIELTEYRDAIEGKEEERKLRETNLASLVFLDKEIVNLLIKCDYWQPKLFTYKNDDGMIAIEKFRDELEANKSGVNV